MEIHSLREADRKGLLTKEGEREYIISVAVCLHQRAAENIVYGGLDLNAEGRLGKNSDFLSRAGLWKYLN